MSYQTHLNGQIDLPAELLIENKAELLGELKTEQANFSWIRTGGATSIFNGRLTWVFNDVTTFEGTDCRHTQIQGVTSVSVAVSLSEASEDVTKCRYPSLDISDSRRTLAPALVELSSKEVEYNNKNAKIGEINNVILHGNGRKYVKAVSSIIQLPGSREGIVFYHTGKTGIAGKVDTYDGIGYSVVSINAQGLVRYERRGEMFGATEPMWGNLATMVHQDYVYLYGHMHEGDSESREIYLIRVSLQHKKYESRDNYEIWDGERFCGYFEMTMYAQKYAAPVMRENQSGTIWHSTAFAGFGQHGMFVFLGSHGHEDSIVRISFALCPWGPFTWESQLLDLKEYGEDQRMMRGCSNAPRKFIYAHPWVSDLSKGQLLISWTEPFPFKIHLARLKFKVVGSHSQIILDRVLSNTGAKKLPQKMQNSLARFTAALQVNLDESETDIWSLLSDSGKVNFKALERRISSRNLDKIFEQISPELKKFVKKAPNLARRRGRRDLQIFPCASGAVRKHEDDRSTTIVVHHTTNDPTNGVLAERAEERMRKLYNAIREEMGGGPIDRETQSLVEAIMLDITKQLIKQWPGKIYSQLMQVWNLEELTTRHVKVMHRDSILPILQIRYRKHSSTWQNKLIRSLLTYDAGRVAAEEGERERVYEEVWVHMSCIQDGPSVVVQHDSEYHGDKSFAGLGLGWHRNSSFVDSTPTQPSTTNGSYRQMPSQGARFYLGPRKTLGPLTTQWSYGPPGVGRPQNLPPPTRLAPASSHATQLTESKRKAIRERQSLYRQNSFALAIHYREEGIPPLPPSEPLAVRHGHRNRLPREWSTVLGEPPLDLPPTPSSSISEQSEYLFSEHEDKKDKKAQKKPAWRSKKQLKKMFNSFKEKLGLDTSAYEEEKWRKVEISGPMPEGRWEAQQKEKKARKKEEWEKTRGHGH